MKSIYRKQLATVALIWAGCVILFLFAYMFVLSPQIKTKIQVENNLAKKQQMYQSALKAAQEQTRVELQKQNEQLGSRLTEFVTYFENCANLTFDIGQIANEKNISSFSIGGKDSRGITGIPDCNYIGESYIDINFNSGFNQFATFLNTLERHRPVIFIDEFSISRSLQQDEGGHRVSMNVSVFVKK